VPQLVEFWDRVQRRDPPPPRLERTVEVIKAVYNQDEDNTIAFDDELTKKVLDWNELKKQKNAIKEEISILHAEITGALQKNRFGALTNGHFVKWAKVKNKNYRKLSMVQRRK